MARYPTRSWLAWDRVAKPWSGRNGRVRALAWASSTLFALFAWSGCREQGPVVIVHGSGEPVRVRVELALTAAEQARGLMWRDKLDSDAGMLFVFAHPRERTFWMKNTIVPLDIIYIDAAGNVVSVAEKTTPYSLAPVASHGPAKYVLEVNAGFARANGIGPGARVELPPLEGTRATGG